jgi:hypothetical protein
MIVADELRQIGYVFVGFAGDVDAIIAKQLFTRTMFPASIGKRRSRARGTFKMMVEEGNPARGCFEKAEPQIGKLLRNLTRDQVSETNNRRQVGGRERPIQLEVEKVE